MIELPHYLLTTAIVLGIGGPTVATRLHQRWLAARGASFTAVYATVLMIVIGCGASVFRGVPLLLPATVRWPLDAVLGLIVGWGAFATDRAINRRWQRRELRRGTGQATARPNEQRVWRALATPGQSPVRDSISLLDLLVLAALEEAVFRGVLVRVVLSVDVLAVAGALLVALAGVFALEHLPFGWSHVVGKLPFSAAVTAGAVVLGSSLMPIAAHLTLNLLVHRHLRNTRRGGVHRGALARAPF